MRLWQNMVSGVDELRLEVALKMLKSPHFNAKMNSLKEVCMIQGLLQKLVSQPHFFHGVHPDIHVG